MQSNHEDNLLLRVENDLDMMEDDYNSRTPKMIQSDDEDCVNKRPAAAVLEELLEESREESIRGDSNTLFYIPQHLQKVDDMHQQILDQKFFHIVNQIDHEIIKETRSNRTGGSQMQQYNNRMYDSDIFVMSNTTFDEDLTSKSSRRVSLGKQ